MMRHLNRALALAAAGLVALSACAPELPEVQVDPAPTASAPVLSAEQNQTIMEAIGATLAEASATLDPALLGARLTGPALVLRSAELQVAAATGDSSGILEMPVQLQSQYLTTTTTWPRVTFAVSDRPQDLTPERLFVTEQATARDNYKLWGWVRLFPGVTIPEFPGVELGTETVAADDASLVLTPADAIAHYADVLLSGDGSAYAAEFGADPLRDRVVADRAKQEAAASTIEGTYSISVTATEGEQRALRTSDGGAVVVGQITSASTLAGKEGAIVNPTAAQTPFLAGAAATNSVSWGRTSLVAIYIPPAAVGGIPTVLGSELLTTSASIP